MSMCIEPSLCYRIGSTGEWLICYKRSRNDESVTVLKGMRDRLKHSIKLNEHANV
jgi:argininosuccinate lyase